MITHKKGDVIQALLDGEIDVMVHGVNCSGGFGSGIAGQIKNHKDPDIRRVREAYLHKFEHNGWKLAEVQPIQVKKDKFICNAATQQEYGADKNKLYVSYEAIAVALNKTKEWSRLKEAKIGIPYIGAGRANGEWSKILAIVENIYKDYDITIYQYEG